MTVKNISNPIIIAVAGTSLLATLGGYVFHEEHRQPLLEIFVFSLKSGSSIFIRTPEDRRILIDGGGNAEVVREISKILPFYSRRIDFILATNSQGKNISGLIDVVERYNIIKAFIPSLTLQELGLASSTDQIYETFLEVLVKKNIEPTKVKAGDHIQLDKDVGVTVTFPVPDDKFMYSKASGPELLFDISYGSTNFAFMGHASTKVQKYVVSENPISVDVLVVSHSAWFILG
jgi:competence protein ComEC